MPVKYTNSALSAEQDFDATPYDHSRFILTAYPSVYKIMRALTKE
jgi:hypothetical protein